MDPLFDSHTLNEVGQEKAQAIAHAFDDLLDKLMKATMIGPSGSTREFALVRTYLEIAAFYAKKAMAVQRGNQQ